MKNVIIIRENGISHPEAIENYRKYCKKCIDEGVLVIDDTIESVELLPIGSSLSILTDILTENVKNDISDTENEDNEVLENEEKEV